LKFGIQLNQFVKEKNVNYLRHFDTTTAWRLTLPLSKIRNDVKQIKSM
jgi:hypothetical protein